MAVYCSAFQLLTLGPLYAAYQINILLGLMGSLAVTIGVLILAGGGFVLIDAFFLSKIGTTPGKWLLKTRVTHADGSYLSFMEALWRDLKMLWRGQALGIPLISLFASFNAYRSLKANGITSWDSEGHFQVTHQYIGAKRLWTTIGGYLAFILIFNLFEHFLLSGFQDQIRDQIRHQTVEFIQQMGSSRP